MGVIGSGNDSADLSVSMGVSESIVVKLINTSQGISISVISACSKSESSLERGKSASKSLDMGGVDDCLSKFLNFVSSLTLNSCLFFTKNSEFDFRNVFDLLDQVFRESSKLSLVGIEVVLQFSDISVSLSFGLLNKTFSTESKLVSLVGKKSILSR